MAHKREVWQAFLPISWKKLDNDNTSKREERQQKNKNRSQVNLPGAAAAAGGRGKPGCPIGVRGAEERSEARKVIFIFHIYDNFTRQITSSDSKAKHTHTLKIVRRRGLA